MTKSSGATGRAARGGVTGILLATACLAAAGCAVNRDTRDTGLLGKEPRLVLVEYRILVREHEGDEGPGTPLAFAPIRWYVDERPFPSRDSPWTLRGDAITDAEGLCRLRLPVTEWTAPLTLFVRLDGRWRFVDALAFSPQLVDPDHNAYFSCPEEVIVVRHGDWCVGVMVLDEETGKPIEGAQVSRVIHDIGAPPDVWEPAATESDGRVAFDGIGKREWDGQVDVQCAGYAPARKSVSKSRMDTRVYYGVYLSRAWEIRGQVVDIEGHPMPGVWVLVSYMDPRSWEVGSLATWGEWWYRTDDDGRFTVAAASGLGARIRACDKGYDISMADVPPGKHECLLRLRPGSRLEPWDDSP